MKQSPYPHYVYVLSDPRTGQPFYVGKGTAYRYKAHETEARTGNDKVNKGKCDFIREIWEAGMNVQYELIPCTSHETTFDKEQELIRLYGRRVDNSGILFNVDRGGRDRWRPKTSDRAVYVFSTSGERLQMYKSARHAATDFNCDSSVISKVARRDKLFRDSVVLSYKSLSTDQVLTSVATSRPAKRRVIQLTLEGTPIVTHESAYEAGRASGLREDGVYTALREVALGKRKTAKYGGFLWEWANP